MRQYIAGWWTGLSATGRTVATVVIALCVIAALWLILANSAAFASVWATIFD